MICNFWINTINFKHSSCLILACEASVRVVECCCACIWGVETPLCPTHGSLFVCRRRVVQQGRNQPCYRLWQWCCSSPPQPAGALSHQSHSTLKCPVAASPSLACSSPDIQGHDFQGHRQSCPVENRMKNGTKVISPETVKHFPSKTWCVLYTAICKMTVNTNLPSET